MIPPKTEIIVNLWFIVDINTGFCCEWMIKAYCISGTDQVKTATLKQLAETDFYTAFRFPIRKSCRIVSDEGTIEGVVHLSGINSELEINMDHYISKVEDKLPLQVQFPYDAAKRKVIRLRMGDSPLFVKTILMENEAGEIRPYTTPENIEWYHQHRDPNGPLLF